MKMQNNLRCLFISALWLLLNHTTYTAAQRGRITFQDLPDCAVPCADTAAVAVNCSTKDTQCLCSHQTFSTATVQCSRNDCLPNDLTLTREILAEMCSDVSTTSSSTTTTTSTSSTSTDQTKTTTTASTTATSTSSTSQSSSTPITVAAPSIPSSSSPTVTQSASSTVFVVQTVVVDQPSTTASAAGRLDFGSISMVTRALAVLTFGLPLFILGVAVI